MDFSTDEQYWIGIADERNDNAKALFRLDFKIDKRETEIQGHPVTVPVERIKILTEDDKSTFEGVVTDEHRERFRSTYERFKAKGEPGMVNGTPIREWPYLTREWLAKLQFLEIHTVEEIADASDSRVETLGPGGRDLKKRAIEFLRPAEQNEQAWRQEKRDLQQEIDQLKAQVQQMLNQPAPEKRGPGRPKKAA